MPQEFFYAILCSMTPIQTEILKALDDMGDKSKFTDTVLAKKLRENAKIDGKKKAVIALADIIPALEASAGKGRIFAVTVTNANDLLFERSENLKEIPLENKQRRQRHEKSQALFTNADLSSKDTKSKGKGAKCTDKKRTERKSMDVNRIYDEE